MQLLLMLAGQPRQPVSRRDLEATVWAGRIVTDDAVTNAVAKLRRAFGDSARSPRFIETVPKQGYRLLITPVPLQTLPAPRPPSARPWGILGAGALTVTLLIGFLAGRPVEDAVTTGPVTESGVSAQRPTIAVLPLANLSGDPDHKAFVDAVSRDLVTALSSQPDLDVLAARATFHLDRAGADVARAVRDLGAAYMLRGGLVRQDGQIEVELGLVETVSGRTLWSERLQGPEATMLEIQREIARTLAGMLEPGHKGGTALAFQNGVTSSLAAYEEFLQGLAAYLRITPEDNETARIHFLKAMELDPGFARAHTGLALTWVREVMDGWTTDHAVAFDRAATHVAKAEAIAPGLPQVHFVKGMIALFQGRHLAAAEAAQRATALDPNFADGYALLAWILAYGGRPDVAADALQEALRLNPLSTAAYEGVAGEISFALGHYDDAAARFQEALARNPTHARARLWLAASLANSGRYDDARWELTELRVEDPDLSLDSLAFGFPHKDPDVPRRFFNALETLGLPQR